jgi:sec-independent protein translocase protein TatC
MPDLATEPEHKDIERELRQMGSMSLLQHLEELRKCIIRSAAAIGVCFLACWYFAQDHIYPWIQKPIIEVFERYKIDPHLSYLNPTDPFNLYMKVGLMAGIFLASPVVLYHYGTQFRANITITEYTKLFLTIILGLALIFELPIVLGFAGLMGVVNAKFLFKHIRGAVLIFFVVAAVLSPTTDIMNMTIYAAPMVLLYIGSIGIVWLVHPKQRRKRAEKRKQQDLE